MQNARRVRIPEALVYKQHDALEKGSAIAQFLLAESIKQQNQQGADLVFLMGTCISVTASDLLNWPPACPQNQKRFGLRILTREIGSGSNRS